MFKKLIKEFINRRNLIPLEYPIQNVPRYGRGQPTHDGMHRIISSYGPEYKKWISSALELSDQLFDIDEKLSEKLALQTIWRNDFLPGLDIIMLYTIVSKIQPKRYLEIGSGISTHIARQAIEDQGLDTEIIIIDPSPRKAIDSVADSIINDPVEKVNLEIFSTLQKGDILFMDGSHRILPNSDAMVFFLDILPKLNPGCIVQIHDVYWPYDYPQFMCDRYYSEQYGLAISMLSNPDRFKLLSANYYISQNEELAELIKPIWTDKQIGKSERHGGSFWFEIS